MKIEFFRVFNTGGPDRALRQAAERLMRPPVINQLPIPEFPKVVEPIRLDPIRVTPLQPAPPQLPSPLILPLEAAAPATVVLPVAPLALPTISFPAALPAPSVGSYGQVVQGLNALSPLAKAVVSIIKAAPLASALAALAFIGMWFHSKASEISNVDVVLKAQEKETVQKNITIQTGKGKAHLQLTASPGDKVAVKLESPTDLPTVYNIKIDRGRPFCRVDVFPIGSQQIVRIEQ